jgi:hypothetical protein
MQAALQYDAHESAGFADMPPKLSGFVKKRGISHTACLVRGRDFR